MKDKVYDDVVADSDMSLRTYLRQCCSGFIKNHKLEKGHKEKWLEDFLEITNDRVVIFVNYNMVVYFFLLFVYINNKYKIQHI